MLCLLTLYIYFDYIAKFRGEDFYFRSWRNEDGTIESAKCIDIYEDIEEMCLHDFEFERDFSQA